MDGPDGNWRPFGPGSRCGWDNHAYASSVYERANLVAGEAVQNSPGRETNVGIFKPKKQPEAGGGAAQTSAEMQDLMQREMEKIFGRRGPAHLVALIPDPGVAEPGRVSWVAIPSWDRAHVVADGINAQAPVGWHARVADWDIAMPNYLF